MATSTNPKETGALYNKEVVLPLCLLLCCLAVSFADPLQQAGYPPADLELSKGKFLIATQKQTDPRFMQTVVLMIHHDKEGGLGLIINYPAGVNVSKMFPEVKRATDPLFFGGPVEPSRMFLLVRSSTQPEQSVRVFDHTYFSTSEEVLRKRGPASSPTERLRVFAGYSGWGAGQLEAEIHGGHWFVWHADAEMIFNKPAKDVWPEMIRRASVLQAFLRIVIGPAAIAITGVSAFEARACSDARETARPAEKPDPLKARVQVESIHFDFPK